jgi:AcrR family transcriptional regulator
MTGRRSDTRQRMLASTSELMCRYGASGTSIDAVLLHSRAPRGSFYHHFPRGRAQLIEEALQMSSVLAPDVLEAAGTTGPLAAFDAYVAGWRQHLQGNDFRSGCPVLAVAVETNDDAPQLAAAAAGVFTSWTEALAAALAHHDVPVPRARSLATLIIASLEGAVALCRVQRSLQPLDDVADELRLLLRACLAKE